MPNSGEIKAWLAIIAKARLALSRAVEYGKDIDGVYLIDLERAGDYLDDAFDAGLKAHGQALLKEYLAASSPRLAS
jgi:hypothetical protein